MLSILSISQLKTFFLIVLTFFSILFFNIKIHKKRSLVKCSCVFLTKIVSVLNEVKLNSDFEKLKLVKFSLNKLVFSPSYSSNNDTPFLLISLPFLA